MTGSATRRSALAMVASLPLAGLMPGESAAAGAATGSGGKGGLAASLAQIDPLAAYLRARIAQDDRVAFGYLEGQYFGVINSQPKYLFNVLAGTFTMQRPLANGTHQRRQFEIAYMVDGRTGLPLQTFANPFTGEQVEVPRTRLGPGNALLRPEGPILRGPEPGLRTDSRFLPPVAVHQDVWVTENNFASMTSAGAAPFHYSEVTIAHIALSDMLDLDRPFVPATVSTTIEVNWRPWLRMGDRPGHMLLSGAGRTGDTLAVFPDRYRALGEKDYPEVFADPRAFLTKDWK